MSAPYENHRPPLQLKYSHQARRMSMNKWFHSLNHLAVVTHGTSHPLTSGVLSLTAKPVPPLVNMQLTCFSSAHSLMYFWMDSVSSGTMCVSTTSHFPDPSSRVDCKDDVLLSVDGS